MAKNNKLYIVLPVLLVLSALVWMPTLKSMGPSTPAGQSMNSRDKSLEEAKNELQRYLASLTTSVPTSSPHQWGSRNPFKPQPPEVKEVKIEVSQKPEPEPVAAPTMTFTLTGIFWNDSRPSAIVNGSFVRVGSTIGEAVVKAIGPREVVISDGRSDIVLKTDKEGF